jgi:hypothetical protein
MPMPLASVMELPATSWVMRTLLRYIFLRPMGLSQPHNTESYKIVSPVVD